MRWTQRSRLKIVTAVAAALLAPSSGLAKGEGRNMNDRIRGLAVSVDCDCQYDSGFPILISVEVRNTGSSWTYIGFEPFDLFQIPWPVSFTLTGADGHEWLWPSGSQSRYHEEPSGIPFRPGEAYRALYDLSEIGFEVPPGQYHLIAEFAMAGAYATSKPVRIEIRRSDPHDHAIVKRLRASNDKHEPIWSDFVTENWSTPNTADLSERGRARLAYYLYLHRAAYGPVPVAKLDPEEPERLFGGGLLEGEAALARLEILHAAKQPEAKGIAKAILERWPGLAWRVRDIKQGAGLLTSLRSDGIKSPYAPKGKPRPYAPSH